MIAFWKATIVGASLLCPKTGESFSGLSRQHGPSKIIGKGQLNDQRKQWIQERLRLSNKDIERLVQKNPGILRFKSETIGSKIGWYENTMGMNRTEILRVATGGSGLLGSFENNEYKVQWLQESLCLSSGQVAHMIKARSTVLSYSVETLEKRLEWLRDRLAYSTNATDVQKLGRLVRSAPVVLVGLSEDSLAEKFAWLQKRLYLKDKVELRKFLNRYGAILNKSVEGTMEAKFLYLQKRLSLTDRQVGKVIRGAPTLFSLSIERRIEPKLQFLKDLFGLSEEGLSAMVCAFPNIIVYNPEYNIAPKVDFFKEIYGENEALSLIAHNPRFISYSLEDRLKRRHRDLIDYGLEHVPPSVWVIYAPSRWEGYLSRHTKLL